MKIYWGLPVFHDPHNNHHFDDIHVYFRVYQMMYGNISKEWMDVYSLALTHWGRDKTDAILLTTFSNVLSWMKALKFLLKFHWSLFPRVQLTIFQHWFRKWIGAVQATSYYLNQWCPKLPMCICITQPQWVKRCICLYLKLFASNFIFNEYVFSQT